jgi:predicted transposase YdaD
MNLYDSWILEGTIDGRIEGKIEGMIEGRTEGMIETDESFVSNSHKLGISISMIANITQLSEDKVLEILKRFELV